MYICLYNMFISLQSHSFPSWELSFLGRIFIQKPERQTIQTRVRVQVYSRYFPGPVSSHSLKTTCSARLVTLVMLGTQWAGRWTDGSNQAISTTMSELKVTQVTQVTPFTLTLMPRSSLESVIELNMYIFVLREETREPGESPCKHGENMQTLNLDTSHRSIWSHFYIQHYKTYYYEECFCIFHLRVSS